MKLPAILSFKELSAHVFRTLTIMLVFVLAGCSSGINKTKHLLQKKGECLNFIYQGLEEIRQGDVRESWKLAVSADPFAPPVSKSKHPVQLPDQNPVTSLQTDLVGAWKDTGWILLISPKYESLMVYINLRGRVKLETAGEIRFTSVWANGPTRTEIFGSLDDGRITRKLPYETGIQTFTRMAAAVKAEGTGPASTSGWVNALTARVRSFYLGQPSYEKSAGLAGFWKADKGEDHLLVTSKGRALFFQIRDFGVMTVDPAGRITGHDAGRAFTFARLLDGIMIDNQGCYQNMFKKYVPAP